MRKVEIARRIAEETGLTNVKAEDVVNAVLEEIKLALEAGDEVILRRFGTFSVRDKGSRVGRNPKTGDAAPITARKVGRFKPGKVFKAAVNGSAVEAVESQV